MKCEKCGNTYQKVDNQEEDGEEIYNDLCEPCIKMEKYIENLQIQEEEDLILQEERESQ